MPEPQDSPRIRLDRLLAWLVPSWTPEQRSEAVTTVLDVPNLKPIAEEQEMTTKPPGA